MKTIKLKDLSELNEALKKEGLLDGEIFELATPIKGVAFDYSFTRDGKTVSGKGTRLGALKDRKWKSSTPVTAILAKRYEFKTKEGEILKGVSYSFS